MIARAIALLCLPVAATIALARPLVAGQPVTAHYEVDRLGDYVAQVSWRHVHHEANTTLVCRGEGSAVFLGQGRFLTAAHVVDQNPLRNDCAPFGTVDPVIEFGGTILNARIVAVAPWSDEGMLTYRGGWDLALIEVDERMIPVALRSAAPLAICARDLPEGMQARVATEYGVDAATIRARTHPDFARLDFAARGGDSGGGVFDIEHRCLAGLISNGGRDGANYVANEVIRRFLSGSLANNAPGAPQDTPATVNTGALAPLRSLTSRLIE